MEEVKVKVVLYPENVNRENKVADMARLCYADDEVLQCIFNPEEINELEDAALIRRLAEMRHWSPFEHASWTFKLDGVSRVLTHQLVRHRTGKFSQRSQRYVNEGDFNFVVPDAIKDAGLVERYVNMMETSGKFYSEIATGLERVLGLTGEARNEIARYVLPGACSSGIGVTMDGNNILKFFNQRLCNRAQKEIRDVSKMMLDLAKPTAPNIFRYAGPTCYTEGTCHEGKKSCGRAGEMRELYKGESI